MSANPQSRGLSVDEFMATVRNRMESQRCLAAEAVDALWAPDQLSTDALYYFARYGAISVANNGEHNVRRGYERANAGQRPSGPRAVDKVERLLLHVALRAADGTRKYLIDFTAEDWDAFKAEASLQLRGWRNRHALAKYGLEQMEQHQAQTTRDLPLDVLAALQEKASKAW